MKTKYHDTINRKSTVSGQKRTLTVIKSFNFETEKRAKYNSNPDDISSCNDHLKEEFKPLLKQIEDNF